MGISCLRCPCNSHSQTAKCERPLAQQNQYNRVSPQKPISRQHLHRLIAEFPNNRSYSQLANKAIFVDGPAFLPAGRSTLLRPHLLHILPENHF